MDDTDRYLSQPTSKTADLHGNPLPPPRTNLKRPSTITTAQPLEPQPEPETRREQGRRLYYEHTAPTGSKLELQWRHAHWQEKRETIKGHLARSGSTAQQLHNFENCGSGCYCQWSELLQRRRLTAFYCKSRHCEPCGRAKANRIAANLKAQLKGAGKNEYRLMTFTLAHKPGDPLLPQIRRLYACFKKLRETRHWKESQKGGAVILEVKYVQGWHAHLHAIVQGSYLAQSTLSELWHKVTGDSYVADIRVVHRYEDAANYVCKYITKSTSSSVWAEDDRAQEYITAIKGVRGCGTFGSWRKFPLTKVCQPATDWKFEDTLSNIVKRAAGGELVAQHILNDLRRNGGGLDHHQAAAYLPPEPEPFTIDDLPAPDG